MTDPTSPSSSAERAAWDWARQRQGRRAGPQGASFRRWLAEAPEHAEAYSEACGLWELTEQPAQRLAREEAAALNRYLEAMDNPPAPARGRHWLQLPAALAATVLLACWAGGWWHPSDWLDNLQADYITHSRQRQQIELADGSQVILDADSALSLDLDGPIRHVRLLRGAAWFKVHPDAGHPFVVETALGAVRVLGTEFAVRHLSERMRVTVEGGRVAVSRTPDTPALATLIADQQLTLTQDQAIVPMPSTVDAAAQLSWRDGWLSFQETPLQEVLDYLGPYYEGRILLLNAELGQRRISGTFPANRPQAVLNALQAVLHFDQQQLLGRIILIR